jgi:hypothetical protein
MDDLTREGPPDDAAPVDTSPPDDAHAAADPAEPSGPDPAEPSGSDVATAVLDPEDPVSVEPDSFDADPEELDPLVLAAADEAERERRRSIQTWVGWTIALGAAVLVFASLNPRLVLTDSTATGGDMGAHVWGPRFLMDHLLPSLRVTGWTPDWYAGFPAYVYYMVVPSLLVVWLSAGSGMWDGSALGIVVGLAVRAALMAGLVLGARAVLARVGDRWFRPLVWVATVFVGVLLVPVPYNIAFKVVTVSGLVTLPIALYVFGRAAKVPFPGPPVMALAALFFIYDKGFTILGGNGASTMAGEFAFSISLTLSFLYLAVVFRGIRTGRDRALGAVLFGLTILCHLIPAIFAVIVTVVLLFVRREDREPWWDASVVGRVVAGVLVAVTLLLLLPGDNVPVLGDLIDTVFPQWLFPAFASMVAIALFTGFQPMPASWISDQARRRMYLGGALVVSGLLVVAAALVGVNRWTWALLVVGVVIACFAGVDGRLFRWGVIVGPVGFLLTLFWFLPFYGNSTFMNDMGWEKYTQYTDYLLADPSLDSGGMPYRNLVFALAGLGILLALLHRVRLGYFLALTVMAFAWIFRFFPQYRLWNARLLPFYYLALYLLAGLALALVVRSVAIAVQEWANKREEPAWVGAFGAGLLAVVVLVVMMGAFSWLPGGTPGTDPTNPKRSIYTWAGIDFETTIVHNWAQWNYAGLEGKDAYPEFAGIMSMMSDVADEHGCGRAMWEYEGDLQRYGTPMALMLLPYFTDGCVGSMEGLYFESSTTTPFHFLNQSELSAGPSRAQRDLPYSAFDIDRGVSHLQMMGVKYYMATTDSAIEAASTDDRLTQVADETFTYIDSATGQPVEQRWVVYEVAASELVVPLENEPVVLSDADDHIDGWVYAKEEVEAVEGQPRPPKNPGPAVLWYNDPTRWDVLLATSGPDSWQRAPSTAAEMPVTGAPEVQVSEVTTTTDSISFSVDQVGVPVLVRVSYFPNWTLDGADGPYRVTPNFMVVVPTENQVTLSYGRSSLEWLGLLATLVGVALVGVLMVADRRRALASEPALAGAGAAVAGSPDLPDPHGAPLVDDAALGGPVDGGDPGSQIDEAGEPVDDDEPEDPAGAKDVPPGSQ